jgi:hypothetical protein
MSATIEFHDESGRWAPWVVNAAGEHQVCLFDLPDAEGERRMREWFVATRQAWRVDQAAQDRRSALHVVQGRAK